MLLTLENEGFTPQSVPAHGLQVTIQCNGNLSIDETDQVHPRRRPVHTPRWRPGLTLDVAGIDMIARDVSHPLEEQGARL